MEKDLEKDIRRVAQAERLSEEEQLHGDNIAGTFEVNEDIEDKYELITKLRKKLKVWRGILIAGFIILLIILLYMLYIYRGSKEPTPAPEPDPVVSVNQEVTTITVNLEDKLPETIDMSYLDIKTYGDYAVDDDYTREVMINPSNGHCYIPNPGGYACIEASDSGFAEIHKMDYSQEIITYESLLDAMAHTSRPYELVDSLTSQEYRRADVPIGRVDDNTGDYVVEFYNSESDSEVSLEDCVLQKDIIELGVFFAVNKSVDTEEVGAIIKDYFENTITCGGSGFRPDFEGLINTLRDKYGIDSYYTNEDGEFVFTQNGAESIPENVTQIELNIAYSQYNPLALAYYYDWY